MYGHRYLVRAEKCFKPEIKKCPRHTDTRISPRYSESLGHSVTMLGKLLTNHSENITNYKPLQIYKTYLDIPNLFVILINSR